MTTPKITLVSNMSASLSFDLRPANDTARPIELVHNHGWESLAMEALRDAPLWYLSTPYEFDRVGLYRARVQVALAALDALHEAGVFVVSPLVMAHAMVETGNTWLADRWVLDPALLSVATGVIVLDMPGSEACPVFQSERKLAKRDSVPVWTMEAVNA